jgi:hypothetical protein
MAQGAIHYAEGERVLGEGYTALYEQKLGLAATLFEAARAEFAAASAAAALAGRHGDPANGMVPFTAGATAEAVIP